MGGAGQGTVHRVFLVYEEISTKIEGKCSRNVYSNLIGQFMFLNLVTKLKAYYFGLYFFVVFLVIDFYCIRP